LATFVYAHALCIVRVAARVSGDVSASTRDIARAAALRAGARWRLGLIGTLGGVGVAVSN